MRHIQEAVAEHFAVPVAMMTGPKFSTTSSLHLPRHVAMFFSRRAAGKSYLDIAQRFNRHDHSTAMYAERKIARLCIESNEFAEQIKVLGQNFDAVKAVENSFVPAFYADSESA